MLPPTHQGYPSSMPEASIPAARSKIRNLFVWGGVILIWAIFLTAVAVWNLVGWFRGYSGRRRLRRLAFWLPLFTISAAAWKVGPVLWARFVLLDQAAFAARRSEGVDTAQVEAGLRAEAMRLGLSSILLQDGAIEVEKFEEEDNRRCRVRLGFTQEVHLLRWTWSIPIKGAVDETILPKPVKPWSDENLVQ